MNGEYKKIRIFLASPGDAIDERNLISSLEPELNRDPGDALKLVLQLEKWEMDATPGIGRPQSIINKILDEADIFICIFRFRFGSPTGEYLSGTEEEFHRAFEKAKITGKPYLLLYFCDSESVISGNTEQRQQKLEQY